MLLYMKNVTRPLPIVDDSFTLDDMADKILEELRIRLRDGLTSAVMKNLVDDLLDKKVLNKEESEEILHQMKLRSDQARDLIDSVKRKGNKACEILFESLQRHDETLYQNLEISERLEAHRGLYQIKTNSRYYY